MSSAWRSSQSVFSVCCYLQVDDTDNTSTGPQQGFFFFHVPACCMTAVFINAVHVSIPGALSLSFPFRMV